MASAEATHTMSVEAESPTVPTTTPFMEVVVEEVHTIVSLASEGKGDDGSGEPDVSTVVDTLEEEEKVDDASAPVLFPMCDGYSTEGLSDTDTRNTKSCAAIARATRDLLRSIVHRELIELPGHVTEINLALKEMGKALIPDVDTTFMELAVALSDILCAKTMVKQSNKVVQADVEVRLADILSDSGKTHVHSFTQEDGTCITCPFHILDNLSHCLLAAMRTLKHATVDMGLTIRRFMTALLHDIGKKSTLRITKYGNITYAGHCLFGSIQLIHLWSPEAYGAYFTAEQWQLMSDTVLYHMCGPNKGTCDEEKELLAKLPAPLLEELRVLGIADHTGDIPFEAFDKGLPYTAADEWDIVEGLIGTQTTGDFMTKLGLRGILFALMGRSAQGKTTVALEMKEKLITAGVPEFAIHIINRDYRLLEAAAKISGIPIEELDGAKAHEIVEARAAEQKAAGKKTIKQEITESMKEEADYYLQAGHIVFYDTMGIFFGGARKFFMPSEAKNALRIAIWPVRTTIIDDADLAGGTRHGMDMVKQIDLAGAFSILDEPVDGGVGDRNGLLSDVRPVSAGYNFVKDNNSMSPHFNVTVATKVRPGQKLPNTLLEHVLTWPTELEYSEATDPTETMNMCELLNYLWTRSQAATHEERVCNMIEFFLQRAYGVSFPMKRELIKAQYILAKKEGREEDATALSQRMFRTPSAAEVEASKITPDHIERLVDVVYSFMTIKYLDGINRQWKGPWNIEARSCIAFWTGKEWRVIYAMPRGPEAVGHTEHGVTELQDMDVADEDSYDHFPPHIAACARAFQGSKEAEETVPGGFMASSKRDGMCYRVLYLPRGSPEAAMYSKIIQTVNDPFVNAFAQASRRLTKGGLIIPASNGTAYLAGATNIQEWMVCAMAYSYGITHERLLEIKAGGGTHMDVLMESDLLMRFLTDIVAIAAPDRVEMHTFEAIGGPERRSVFCTKPHTELASGYPVELCGISYLGFSMESSEGGLQWTPHFELEHPFQEPTWWRFPDVATTRRALDDLAKVFGGEIAWDAFFKLYPMANADPAKAVLPDPEGFVVYKFMEAFGREQYIYLKGKTWMYYILHKIRPENIPTILALSSEFAKVFPGYQAVTEFFGAPERVHDLISDLCDYVMTEEMVASVTGKAAGGLVRAPDHVKPKIVLHNATKWKEGAVAIAAKHYPCFMPLVESEPDATDIPSLDAAVEESKEGDLTAAAAVVMDPDTRARQEEVASMLRGMLMTLKFYDGEDSWRAALGAEFDVESIAASRSLGKVASALWACIHGSH